MSKVSITAAACSDGKFMFTVNNGVTSSQTFIQFLILLVQYLRRQDPWWQSRYLVVIDNAPYHRNYRSTDLMKQLNVPILFLGPYQFDLAPVEQTFRYIKSYNLNPSAVPVSTR